MSAIAVPRSQLGKTGPASELSRPLVAILAISALYLLVVVWHGVPRASGFFGHALGVTGSALVLMTETLYSIRKRQRKKAWGRMSDWLRFHIFTGIVGPYMIFLHAAWSFNGLAGVTLLLTGIMVLSGFIGRFIYTAVPRTPDGVIMEAEEIHTVLAAAEAELASGMQSSDLRDHEPTQGTRRLSASSLPADSFTREQAAQIRALLKRRKQLERQTESLATARRMMAVWRSIHIPLGIALFASALIHAAAAFYYATLLH